MIRHPFRAIAAGLVAIALLSACELPPGVEQELSQVIPTQADSGLSPEEYVNSLTYTWQDPQPAMIAWRTVTAARGWDPAVSASWEPFVQAVMARESGFCPNLRRGARVDVWEGCHVARQGGHSDSGFGQVLMGYPNKRGWYRPVNGGTWNLHENASYLCPQEGICSPDEAIASPWNSMTILVALVERAKAGPWCFTARLRRGAVCRLAP
jgi:hypothetical protein